MEKKIWNKENYKDFMDYLYSNADLKFKEFHSGLGIDYSYTIGIRSPILKEQAKNISKTDYHSFFKLNSHKTYEERMIHGLVIGYIKDDFDTIIDMFRDYLPYIDNWALCDGPVANLHIMRKNLKKGFSFVLECLKHENPWYQRIGFVLLLAYYVNDDYIDEILIICDNHKTDKYYVQMAMAWLLSVCYVKHPEKTYTFIKTNKLDSWTHNKAIQKIRESYRVKDEEKEKLIKWRK